MQPLGGGGGEDPCAPTRLAYAPGWSEVTQKVCQKIINAVTLQEYFYTLTPS